MTLHEGSANSGAPTNDQQSRNATSSSSEITPTPSSTKITAQPTPQSASASITTTTSTSINNSNSTPTSSSEQPTEQTAADNNAEQQDSKTIKQFSDKSLEELAQYYLNLEPANIPDTGYVVSGIAGRFPNADNLNELWDNLLNGRDMVLGPDDKRWPLGELLCE